MTKLNIIINNIKFRTTLEDNITSKEFIKLLPLKIEMNQLHKKELYYYLKKNLPTNNIRKDKVEIGTLYLLKDNCLVLSYDTYSIKEEYTPIAQIDSPEDLKSIISNNESEVIIELIKKI